MTDLDQPEEWELRQAEYEALQHCVESGDGWPLIPETVKKEYRHFPSITWAGYQRAVAAGHLRDTGERRTDRNSAVRARFVPTDAGRALSVSGEG